MKLVIGVGIAILVILTLCLSIFVVPAGHTGLIVTGGAVSEGTYSAGFHMKVPFIQGLVEINNQTQKIDVKAATAASKDLQTVTTEIVVNYNVLPNASVNLYKTVGTRYEETIIAPAIPEALKSVTAQYTAEELITKRSEVSEKIKAALETKVKDYGILVDGINVQNFEFSDEFKAAVEAKQTAQQSALKAAYDLERIKKEADQAVAKANGEALAIKAIQDTLNTSPQYIEYMKWQKWDGVLPKVITGGASMIDVGNVAN